MVMLRRIKEQSISVIDVYALRVYVPWHRHIYPLAHTEEHLPVMIMGRISHTGTYAMELFLDFLG